MSSLEVSMSAWVSSLVHKLRPGAGGEWLPTRRIRCSLLAEKRKRAMASDRCRQIEMRRDVLLLGGTSWVPGPSYQVAGQLRREWSWVRSAGPMG